MAIEYSPEQIKSFGAQVGGYILVANAGTGKTTTTAECVVLRYIEEEKRMYPNTIGHVDGDRQRRLLRQFLCVTFTIKAAEEFDARVKKLFAERGIPIPVTRDGKPLRIARTLDSYVRLWLMRREVFDAWMQTDADINNRITQVLELLPTDTREAIGCDQPSSSGAYCFSKHWNWLADHKVSDMLLDLCLRHEDHSPLPGCDVNAWAAAFNEMLQQLRPNEGGSLVSDFWEAPLATWSKHQEEFQRLDHAVKQGQEVEGMDIDAVRTQVLSWDRFVQMREEFMAVQELARARGYHPVYAPERVTARVIEEQLASGEHLKTYKAFLSVAERWHRLKTHFLLREFGDQTTAFVRACESYPEIMERGVEYPRIIRTKYVFWDEVQDNSDFQHRILRLFYATRGRTGAPVPWLSIAIGDPKQQIYCWRGASPRGFLEMIERKRRKEPEKLLGLTCSFRSARRIVALGNEIVQTLPSYRENVQPSSTIFQDEGVVEISRPFITLDEEAEWANEQIEHYLKATNDTVMVVSRSSINDHPLYFRYLHKHAELNKRLTCLTIHRSKGLEADTVIVLGLVAGRLPDYRANSDEEVNLFYVACTRARRTLLLSGLLAKREVNEAGKIEDTEVGPSPFFAKLPTLKELCIASGWTQSLLRQGIDAHSQLLAAHLTRIDKQRVELVRERMAMFPQVEVHSETTALLSDYGVTSADPGLASAPKREMGSNDSGKRSNRMVSERMRERVLQKLISSYRLTRRMPRLETDEFNLARASGWIGKPDGAKYFTFTKALAARADTVTTDAA